MRKVEQIEQQIRELTAGELAVHAIASANV